MNRSMASILICAGLGKIRMLLSVAISEHGRSRRDPHPSPPPQAGEGAQRSIFARCVARTSPRDRLLELDRKSSNLHRCAPSPACGGGLGRGCLSRRRCPQKAPPPQRPKLKLGQTASALLLGLAGALLLGHGVYIHGKAMLAQLLLERAFRHSIASGEITKPWSWADTWPVARIEVPRLRASAIVLSGSSGQALAFGPGHVESTPDAGEPGIAVYAGHRDTHFHFLREVVIGDEIIMTRSDGRAFRYRADRASVVRFDASGIDPRGEGYQLALSTCWPFDAVTPSPERYVLHASLTAGP